MKTDDFERLATELRHHLQVPQKSERWAMYRLIVPVVDLANREMGLRAYFEFNQTSKHGTSQSIDIALLNGTEPVVMVEAKRYGRAVSSEHIAKYLMPRVRGVVTNGAHWVLCFDGSSTLVSFDAEGSASDYLEALRLIVAFIRGSHIASRRPRELPLVARPVVKTERLPKLLKAKRHSNPMQITQSVSELQQRLDIFDSISRADAAFLEGLITTMEAMGGAPSHLRIEARSSRVSFFDSRISGTSQRVARIEFGKTHPDVLVLTSITKRDASLEAIAPSTVHDKGPHMRRFRLANKDQARRFGVALANAMRV